MTHARTPTTSTAQPATLTARSARTAPARGPLVRSTRPRSALVSPSRAWIALRARSVDVGALISLLVAPSGRRCDLGEHGAQCTLAGGALVLGLGVQHETVRENGLGEVLD